MSDLISRVLILKELERIAEIHPYKVIGDRDSYSPYNEAWEDCISLIEERLQFLPSAEPEERTAKVENKWHWNCDPYDESTSPTEEGYYRIIDEDGTEMTDYFFGEPRMTGRGIGYWATCEKTILAWTRLEGTDERATD